MTAGRASLAAKQLFDPLGWTFQKPAVIFFHIFSKLEYAFRTIL